MLSRLLIKKTTLFLECMNIILGVYEGKSKGMHINYCTKGVQVNELHEDEYKNAKVKYICTK